jgi:hypothetical protein
MFFHAIRNYSSLLGVIWVLSLGSGKGMSLSTFHAIKNNSSLFLVRITPLKKTDLSLL